MAIKKFTKHIAYTYVHIYAETNNHTSIHTTYVCVCVCVRACIFMATMLTIKHWNINYCIAQRRRTAPPLLLHLFLLVLVLPLPLRIRFDKAYDAVFNNSDNGAINALVWQHLLLIVVDDGDDAVMAPPPSRNNNKQSNRNIHTHNGRAHKWMFQALLCSACAHSIHDFGMFCHKLCLFNFLLQQKQQGEE